MKAIQLGNLFLLISAALLLKQTQPAKAQQSWLDPDFGNNGIVSTHLSLTGYDDHSSASALQSDGKVLVGGCSLRPIGNSTFNIDAAIFRFNTNGLPDYSFGNRGSVLIDVSNNSTDYVKSIAIQSDGKILLGGYVDGSSEIFIARLNTDGSLDQTFGTSGLFTYTPTGSNDQLQSITVVSNNKILVLSCAVSWPNHKELIRLLSGGTLDGTFGNSGVVDLNITPAATHASMKIDGSNRILIAGEDSDGNFAVARCNAGGTLDNTFGVNGVSTVAVDIYSQILNSIDIQSDGKILLGGQVGGADYQGTDQRIALVRLLDNGTEDGTFGNNGIVITPFASFRSNATSIVALPDGKILVGGSWNNALGSDGGFHVIRYHDDGLIDSTFGTGGLIQTHDGPQLKFFGGLHITSDSNIVFTGEIEHGISDVDFFAALFTVNGFPVHDFGWNGVAWGTGWSIPSSIRANSVALTTDGKIVTAGAVMKDADSSDFLITYYNADGSRNTSIGDSGVMRIVFSTGDFVASSVATSNDGSVIAAGYSNYESAIVKLDATGKCDWGFGDNGFVEGNFGYENSHIEKIAFKNDGKIIGCGEVWNQSGNYSLLIFQLLSDGTPDDSFGNHGIYVHDYNPGNSIERLTDLAEGSNGSIIAAGNVSASQSDSKVLMKVTSTGAPDNSFGNSGFVTYTSVSLNGGNRIALQTDGKIISASETYANDIDGDFEIHRYNADGSADNSFGTNGISIVGQPSVYETDPNVGLLSNGRIAITGYYKSADNSEFVLALLKTNGHPDSTFDADGFVSVNLSGLNIYNTSLVVQPDDAVVTAGYSDDGTITNQVLARFVPSVATGIMNVTASDAMQIYPNPASDQVNVTVNEPLSANTTLLLVDAVGHQINSYNFSHDHSITIKRSSLPAGIYFLQLMSGGKLTDIQKVILN